MVEAMAAEELRSRAWHYLRSSHLRPSHKLALLRHFLLEFSCVGDLESQLVLRHEILSLCKVSSTGTGDSEMRRDILKDWISFAEDCSAAGFPNNARKAYEKVIASMQGCQGTNSEQVHAVHRISKLRTMAESTAKIGVQTGSSNISNSQCARSTTAVSRFMAGIRKKEIAKLRMLHARNNYCIDSENRVA